MPTLQAAVGILTKIFYINEYFTDSQTQKHQHSEVAHQRCF